ncbi:MAG TPA: hypothetical protein DDX47_00500 [Candidatus Jacksonbacteria bacterium]|nr:MAG: hypothetical protein UW45_C0005G0029 [Parcubacteria group bacterium GW2011_GWC2_44_22]OGY76451.1 MAG: hypothetical protein A2295_02255 [Candidatus Jacksonbacteria bacterium RIFOXYB2_FULL_44_15]OGY76822.1 MAG: hypothetical protein A2240_04590 [Candidatus Jacksonbacteria bacterium RIFOXYA2_FULL_43_12]OGY82181.1 MAG: hypothetical protein A2550_05760 [Candidatus Jacksonbacteria bacterium RIFOXYD2_FULL_43_21]HBH45836.1 hypothetical protein [Candidatus Jacksonbacteria bacterium]
MIIGAIIQARTNSTRLPNKVLLPLQEKSVLEHVIIRVRQARKINKIIVATTKNSSDDKIVQICHNMQINYFRGSENDVLDRYYQAAKKFNLNDIVRITGDCPVTDPTIIDQVIYLYQKKNLAYATNVIPPTFPDGLDVEIFSRQALDKAWREAKLKSAREHVTVYMWQNPHLFKQSHLKNKVDLSKRRWVLDNPEDYEFMKQIFTQLYQSKPNFRLKHVLNFLTAHPNIEKINQGIKRNEGLLKSFREDK